jgi:serine phosphatase RsbU (regulator of sigma subunit)
MEANRSADPAFLFGRDRRAARSTAMEDAQRRLADTLPILVMIANGAGEVQFFNKRWYEFTDQPPLVAGEPNSWPQYLHPNDVTAVFRAWTEAVQGGGGRITIRYRLRHAQSGDYRWLSANAVALHDESGTIAQWIGTAVDIHDEVVAREAMQAVLVEQATFVTSFQRALLPKALPCLPGLAFDAYYRTSVQDLRVGGDWYDAGQLRDGRVVFSIGDVVGHGLDAAIEMGRARQSIFTAAVNSADPAEILHRVNRVFSLQGTMATALAGIIDRPAGTITIASAGHPRPIVVSHGTATEIVTPGMALGVLDEIACTPVTIPFAPGDSLVLYTDGLTEFARNAGVAEARLLAMLAHDGGAIAGFAERICAHVIGAAEPADDVAVLVVRSIDT